MASQAATKAAHDRAKKARARARKAANRAANDAQRKRDGAAKANAKSGSAARRETQKRRDDRAQKKADEKSDRQAARDQRRDAAIAAQRKYDRDHRDMKTQQVADDDAATKDAAEKPRGPWEEQPIKEKGKSKGTRAGNVNEYEFRTFLVGLSANLTDAILHLGFDDTFDMAIDNLIFTRDLIDNTTIEDFVKIFKQRAKQ